MKKNRLQTLVLATSSFLPLSFAGNDRNCQSDLATLPISKNDLCKYLEEKYIINSLKTGF